MNADVPTGDRWALRADPPFMWVRGVVLLAVVAAGAWLCHVVTGIKWKFILALFSPLAFRTLSFFRRHDYVLDKVAGTISEEHRLIIGWTGRSTFGLAEKSRSALRASASNQRQEDTTGSAQSVSDR